MGSFCSIARTHVILGGNHRADWMTTFPFGHIHQGSFPSGAVHGLEGHPAASSDAVIGNDCWIGHEALLLSGGELADGAVLGARAVLAGPTEPFGIYVGNPAKLVRKPILGSWPGERSLARDLVRTRQRRPEPQSVTSPHESL